MNSIINAQNRILSVFLEELFPYEAIRRRRPQVDN